MVQHISITFLQIFTLILIFILLATIIKEDYHHSPFALESNSNHFQLNGDSLKSGGEIVSPGCIVKSVCPVERLKEGDGSAGIISRTIALIRKLGGDSCVRGAQASGEKLVPSFLPSFLPRV